MPAKPGQAASNTGADQPERQPLLSLAMSLEISSLIAQALEERN
jgi:hypothetical protein